MGKKVGLALPVEQQPKASGKKGAKQSKPEVKEGGGADAGKAQAPPEPDR